MQGGDLQEARQEYKQNAANGLNHYHSFKQYCHEYLLPLALEAQMEPELFFMDAEPLLELTYRAYQKRTQQGAWLHGLYTMKAMEATMSNVLPYGIAKGLGLVKTSMPPIEYPMEPYDFQQARKRHEITIQEEVKQVEQEMKMMNIFK